jgi:hypothetical protein
MKFEFEFRAAPAPEGNSLRNTPDQLNANTEIRLYHLHHRCFVASELERTKAGLLQGRILI